MRLLIFICGFLVPFFSHPQENWVKQDRDTFLYAFNSEWEPIEPHEAATYVRKAWPLKSDLYYVFDYYKNGAIQMKATARNHDPLKFEEYISGQIRFTEDGDTLSYCRYNDTSALHGKYRNFYESGLLESFGKYWNDKRVGVWSSFHKNGQLESSGSYVEGFRGGNWEFYHENGELEKKVQFKMGKYQGKVIEYFNTGTIRSTANYNDEGQRDGTYELYHIDGYILTSSIYKKGELREEKSLREDSDIDFEVEIKDPAPIWHSPLIGISTIKQSITQELREASMGWAKDRGVYQIDMDGQGKITAVRSIETCNDIIDDAVEEALLGLEFEPAKRGNISTSCGNEFIVWFNYSTIDRIEFGEAYALEAESEVKTSSTGQIFHIVEEQPEFPGGIDQLMKFLIETTRYPAEAKDEGATGVVYVQFVVGRSGIVSHPEILRGVHPALDFEAMRVVKEMPAWTAGRQRGKTVPVYYKIPFRFNLK